MRGPSAKYLFGRTSTFGVSVMPTEEGETMVTHYLPAFTSIRQRLQTAVCGRLINMGEHSAEPTCPKCAAWLAADVAEGAALAKKWDAEEAEKRAR